MFKKLTVVLALIAFSSPVSVEADEATWMNNNTKLYEFLAKLPSSNVGDFYGIEMREKLPILKQMSKWMTFKYMDLRLYTMYGSKYKTYILLHPLIFIRDINRYIEWCINMDKHR